MPVMAAGLDEPPAPRDPEPRTGTRLASKGRRRQPKEGVCKTEVLAGSEGDQEAQDRSGPPAERESLSLSG